MDQRSKAFISLPGAPCSVPGCTILFPVLQIQKEALPKCLGSLDIMVEIDSLPDTSKLRAGIAMAFTHPVAYETKESLEERHPAGQVNMTKAHNTELDAAVSQDMQLLEDPQFLAYIRSIYT